MTIRKITATLCVLLIGTWFVLPASMQTVISNNAADMANHIVMVADSPTGRTVTNAFTFTGTQTFTKSSGTAPFVIGTAYAAGATVTNLSADRLQGQTGPSSSIVGISDTQTLTNKTLTSPAINISVLGNVLYGLCGGRLSLTSGTPVTTSDVTAAVSVFWEPYSSTGTGTGVCGLFDGSSTWTVLPFTETTLAVGTLTNDLPYDVFIFNNSGTLGIESLAWSSKTARATALATQNGVLVKSGATTRRYVGTFHTTATTTTEDSVTKRLLWNYYNRVSRSCKKLVSANYNYSLATWRQSNGDSANQVAIVVGWAESRIFLNSATLVLMGASNADIGSSIGEDSTTTPDASVIGGANRGTGAYLPLFSQLTKMPAVGYHFYAMLEYSQAAGTQNWQPSVATNINYGLSGSIEN